jgi:hypothetical protein
MTLNVIGAVGGHNMCPENIAINYYHFQGIMV